MGPDDDSPIERACNCASGCGEADPVRSRCPGDDGTGDTCSGCGHDRREITENTMVTAPRALTAAGGWSAPFPARSMWTTVDFTPQTPIDFTTPSLLPTPRPRVSGPSVSDRVTAVETAQKALRRNRGFADSEPAAADEIIRLADYILTGQRTSVDVALRD